MTEAYKLARLDDPITSHISAKSINPSKMELIVLEVINQFGSMGCISDQVLELLPQYRYSTITARYKGLKEKLLIHCDGTTEKGASGRPQQVMWGYNYYPNSISY